MDEEVARLTEENKHLRTLIQKTCENCKHVLLDPGDDHCTDCGDEVPFDNWEPGDA
jgi:hypothetical protein